MPIRHAWMLAALVIASSPVAAATVQKCRRPDGSVAYQSAACAPGDRTLATWDAAPDPVLRVPHARRPARDAVPRTVHARRAVRRAQRVEVDPCRAARERRDAIEREVGLARTYDLLSALQRDVYEACR